MTSKTSHLVHVRLKMASKKIYFYTSNTTNMYWNCIRNRAGSTGYSSFNENYCPICGSTIMRKPYVSIMWTIIFSRFFYIFLHIIRILSCYIEKLHTNEWMNEWIVHSFHSLNIDINFSFNNPLRLTQMKTM